jgi:glycosyltransferase involved in cell wall biosynthesis
LSSERLREQFYGGQESFTRNLANWLAQRGIKTTVVCRTLFGVEALIPPMQINPSLATRMRTIRLPYLLFTLGMIRMAALLCLKLLSLNRKRRISLIHAQDTGYAGVASILAGRLLAVPVVISSHGMRFPSLRIAYPGTLQYLPIMLEYFLDTFSCRNGNLIIAVNDEVRKYVVALGAKKVIVVHVGVDVWAYPREDGLREEVRSEMSAAHDELVMGYVGRLAREKNVKALVEAFLRLARTHRNLKLAIIGEGVEKASLIRTVRASGLLSRVLFMGARSDVPRLLAGLDLFVLPSFTEGFPIALLEAMAAGKPIVASNLQGVREIVSGHDCAFLVRPGSVEELARALECLLTDPELRRRLAEGALRRIRDFGSAIFFSRILETYEALLLKES